MQSPSRDKARQLVDRAGQSWPIYSSFSYTLYCDMRTTENCADNLSLQSIHGRSLLIISRCCRCKLVVFRHYSFCYQSTHVSYSPMNIPEMCDSVDHSDCCNYLVSILHSLTTAFSWAHSKGFNVMKVMGSILGEVMGFLSLPNPSSHTMALGSTRSVTEISTRCLPVG
jgi:hypothetical protein